MTVSIRPLDGRLPERLLSPGSLPVRALHLGERIDFRQIEPGTRPSIAPLLLQVGGGLAVAFRFGAVVLFALTADEEESLLALLAGAIEDPVRHREAEEVTLRVDAAHEGDAVGSGAITLPALDADRLQVLATILARSVILAHYESTVAAAFDTVEPMALRLKHEGRSGRSDRALLRQIGDTLLIKQRLVGRAETGDKPDLLWDHPGLERLYLRLEDEYELRPRLAALEQKLELISYTAETALDLLQHRRSLRVEWYIVILIVIDILLYLLEKLSAAIAA